MEKQFFFWGSWFEPLISDHDFGVWFQIAGFVFVSIRFYQLSAGKQIPIASGWMIYQSHLAVRSSHWMCCLVWYENTEKGEDVVRLKSGTVAILWRYFILFFGERWNTVEVHTTKGCKLRTGFERHHSANGPGDMGCRVIVYESDLAKFCNDTSLRVQITCCKWHWNFQTT